MGSNNTLSTLSNDTLSNSTLSLETLCAGEILSRVSLNQGIQGSAFRFLMVFCTLVKMVCNYKELNENKIFALYFLLLLTGGIISFSSQIYLAVVGGRIVSFGDESMRVDEITNSIEIFGILLMDAFFGLMPNLFYSVYQTKLTKVAGHMTKRYFFANGIILAIMFVILVITAFAASNVVISSCTILLIESLYGFSFYLLVIFVLREMEGRAMKIIWRFFYYYTVYAITICFRLSFLLVAVMYIDVMVDLAWATFPLDAISEGVQLLVVALFLREIKFTSKKKSTKVSSASTS